MVDVSEDAARNAGKSAQEEGRGAFAFAGLILDLDACTLTRESGEPIALTRGEFALLREFVHRPGRVLSRDFLLDAMTGRQSVAFDRSVDVMVGRLRRKVEPNPKQPSVIQTVPCEGYRFAAPLSRREPASAPSAERRRPVRRRPPRPGARDGWRRPRRFALSWRPPRPSFGAPARRKPGRAFPWWCCRSPISPATPDGITWARTWASN